MPLKVIKNPWVWGSLGAAIVGLSLIPRVRSTVVDVVVRGKKLSTGAWKGGNKTLGFVETPPETLRQQASDVVGFDVPLDLYALARMIRSEGSAQGLIRAHVALNDLASVSWASGVFELVTYSTDPKRKGYFGLQYSAAVPDDGYPAANKRRYSTAADPYQGDLDVAMTAMTERANGIDRVNGATKFVDKSSMGGVQGGTSSFDALNAKWVADGLRPFTLAEFGSDLVLYKKA